MSKSPELPDTTTSPGLNPHKIRQWYRILEYLRQFFRLVQFCVVPAVIWHGWKHWGEKPPADWQIDGFAGLSAMSGFMLTSLALIHSSLASREMAHLQKVRRSMVNQILASMWLWMLAACIAFLNLIFSAYIAWLIFLAITGIAISQGLIAFCWVTAFIYLFIISPAHSDRS